MASPAPPLASFSYLPTSASLTSPVSPSDVFALFEVEDEALARAFVTSPAVPEAKRQSGVIGETEIVFLGTSENLSNPS